VGKLGLPRVLQLPDRSARADTHFIIETITASAM
jgi:hypothetical protein